MPRSTGQLFDGKPLVQVNLNAFRFDVPALGAVGGGVAIPMREYRALLDTGADISCLCDSVIASEALEPFSMINMTGGAGRQRHFTYMVHLGFHCAADETLDGEIVEPSTVFWLPEAVMAADIRDNRWFDIIIGTDILCQHEFRLGRGGHFSLELFS